MVGIHQYADTYSRKTAKSIKIKKIRKWTLKKIGVSQKAHLENVVKKLHAKFQWGSSIKTMVENRGSYGWKEKEGRKEERNKALLTHFS